MQVALAELNEAIAQAIPDRECIVFGDRRLSWSQLTERSRRLANYLIGRGLGLHRERDQLERWESGQDHIALYLYNGNEYLEGMLGSYKSRSAPVNVNYRYVATELIYLLSDSKAKAVIFHGSFAPVLGSVLAELSDIEVLLQVDNGSGHALLPGAVDYEEALAVSSPDRPALDWSPDDLYVLYTGGTTGMPKGVLWRQSDIYSAAMGPPRPGLPELTSYAEIVEEIKDGGHRLLPAAPFMHGGGQWNAFATFHMGGTVIIPSEVSRLDPEDLWSTVERESVAILSIIGDAFARPLIDELRRRPYDLSSLRFITSGGVTLSAALKRELMEAVPHIMIIDVVGSSESGVQGQHMSFPGGAATGTFATGSGATVLSESLDRVLVEPSDELGWLAQAGAIPLGYLGDQGKTVATFPVVDGVRYSIPGDRVRVLAGGKIQFLGRDSVTINTGGEKVFAEEVEQALRSQPAVHDAVVVGRPSERWGHEVVALVRLRDGASATADELIEACGQHVARYKVPKAVHLVDHIERSPSGKPDYRWARAQAEAEAARLSPAQD